MVRLIDADKLKEHFKRYTINSGIQVSLDRYALKVIEEEPTVDAVPVIRCKDCKFSKAYYHGSESNLGMFTYLCTQGLHVNADDYCSLAERKEE